VSESVTRNEMNALLSDRNLTPMFNKLATKIKSQKMWLPTDFGENPNSVRQNGKF